MNDEEKRAIFDELMVASGVVPQQERHFVIQEFADSQGISYETAKRILEQSRADGQVGREQILTRGGRKAWGYWKV